jgi:hypothetical protein
MGEDYPWAGDRRKALFYDNSVYYYSGVKNQFRVDAYVTETLMADLVLHDRHPSAFLVYLQLWYRSRSGASRVPLSHRGMAHATGLSKSAVQAAIRTLTRRRLIRATRESSTAVPRYTVLRPWRK